MFEFQQLRLFLKKSENNMFRKFIKKIEKKIDSILKIKNKDSEYILLENYHNK